MQTVGALLLPFLQDFLAGRSASDLAGGARDEADADELAVGIVSFPL